MSDILQGLLSGLGSFLSSSAGMDLVGLVIIVCVVGFIFSLPTRLNKTYINHR